MHAPNRQPPPKTLTPCLRSTPAQVCVPPGRPADSAASTPRRGRVCSHGSPSSAGCQLPARHLWRYGRRLSADGGRSSAIVRQPPLRAWLWCLAAAALDAVVAELPGRPTDVDLLIRLLVWGLQSVLLTLLLATAHPGLPSDCAPPSRLLLWLSHVAMAFQVLQQLCGGPGGW